eukprot:TRINITY_DN46723_c0_g1_i1.p1 TRINITY_DN46723_c0_g1~~TRINITY_DN46723_c0_g1_i1.p1  ORF type:complete len:186 (+),score=77.48 TRINITY_DN46723_c0_g1_i1:84-560(+)
MAALDNQNPEVFDAEEHVREEAVDDEDTPEDIDSLEVFDLIRGLKDPEHDNTLEQLKVLSLGNVSVDDKRARVRVQLTPTVPHCSQATLIGLCVRVKLLRTLPPRFKIDIKITPGTHDQEAAVNKQLNDKERVAAALENPRLLDVVDVCLKGVRKQMG